MNPLPTNLKEFAHPAQLDILLSELFPWLNTNMPIDPRKPLCEQDVAHIGLMAHEFEQIPGAVQVCVWKRISFKRAYGVEFWLSPTALPPIQQVSDIRGRIAWKLTGNTGPLFKFKQIGRAGERDKA